MPDETGLDRIARERAHRDAFDATRELPAGALTPRQRIAALVGEDSFFEIGALARSQHASVGDEAPGDGVIAGFGRIDGREVAICVEDALALAATDGAVGRNKRVRLLTHALQGRAPVVYVADGAPRPPLALGEGRLLGRYSDQFLVAPELRLTERLAPFVAVVLGACSGQDAVLAAAADVVVAGPRAALAATPGAGSGAADVTAVDDTAALAAAASAIRLIPAELGTPLTRVPGAVAPAPIEDTIDPLATAGEAVLAGLLDAGSAVPFDTSAAPGLLAGLATLDGFPVAYALGDGPAGALGLPHLEILSRLVQVSARFQVPLVLIQHGAAYDPRAASSPGFLRTLSDLTAALRDSPAPKLVLITGRGHVLGDFVLGGRELGVSYAAAWAQATVGVDEVPHYMTDAAAAVSADGPWDASGSGLVDDVLAPSETHDRFARMLGLLAPARALPSAHGAEGGRIIYR